MENFLQNKYKIIMGLVVITGIIIRLILYFQNLSLWGDEAGLALNTVNKSFIGLFAGLDNCQACPIGFLIISKILLKIFHPENFYIRDLILRFVPLVAGIACIPAFLYFVKILFDNDKIKVLFAVALLTLAPFPIIYSAQYKQYIMEMLITIILLTVFYKIIFFKSKKIFVYSFIISLTLWFSLSSYFIIVSGFMALFIKNKKECLKAAIFPFLSFLMLFYTNLRHVFSNTFAEMSSSWGNLPAFLAFNHPLRFLLRFGEFFLFQNKILAAIIGGIVIYFFIKYIFSKKEISEKVLFAMPMILLTAASLMHLYPMSARLILFLFPVIVIYIIEAQTKADNIIKSSLIFIIFISYFLFDYHLLYSYARDLVPVLENKIQNEVIIYDAPNYEYRLYAKTDLIKNSKPQISIACVEEYFDVCKEYMGKLPTGKYYFLSHNYFPEVVLHNKEKFNIIGGLDIGYEPREIKALHFEVIR